MRTTTFLLIVLLALGGLLPTSSSAEGLSAQLNLELPKGYGKQALYVHFGEETPNEYESAKFDPITFSGWSTSFYGASHHARTSSPFNEFHPGIGLRKHFGSCVFGYANCYAEATHITKNSLGGNLDSIGVGVWFYLGDVMSHRVGVGESVSYIKYEVPARNGSVKGFIHMPTLTFGRGRTDFELGVLTKDVIKWLKGDERAIYTLSFNYKW